MMLVLLIAALADYPLTVDSVHDGDTFTGSVALGFDLQLASQPIRLAEFDAWEITRGRFGDKTTEAELLKGQKAKADLETLLRKAKHVYGLTVNKSGREKYGRLLLKVKIVDEEGRVQDVAELMRAMGHERDK
jgi:endonuclease YncB( thermonuclease family)